MFGNKTQDVPLSSVRHAISSLFPLKNQQFKLTASNISPSQLRKYEEMVEAGFWDKDTFFGHLSSGKPFSYYQSGWAERLNLYPNIGVTSTFTITFVEGKSNVLGFSQTVML